MEHPGFLQTALVFLLAAVVSVPVAKRLGLGSVLGYLLAGMAIGPWGLGLIDDVEGVLHFAEFGVVLLLFLIGLEMNPTRLWSMRRPILGMGGAQVLLTTLALWPLGMLAGLSPATALVGGMGLALSSTAIGLQVLGERNLMPTAAGNGGFSILLFQDIAVIPMLALLPLLGSAGAEAGAIDWVHTLQVAGVIGFIVVGGRYLIRPVFRYVAQTRLREIFTAFSLFLVVGIAWLMDSVGMSMALGTFLAGVLLAESEYRHEIEANIEPFKGLLLGLFFISVGMSVDFGLLLSEPVRVLLIVLALVATKAAVLYGIARVARLPPRQTPLFAILLSQSGEFGFVLFALATGFGVIGPDSAAILVLVVALSMATTPLLLIVHDRWIEPRQSGREERPADTIEEEDNPVLIAGFGRFGQIIGRLLHANHIGTTVLDHDPDQVESLRRFGFKVYYGDAARIDLLRTAGIEEVKLLIIAVDDRELALEIAELARHQFPHLTVLARAWDVVHYFELRKRGVDIVIRETFDSALTLGQLTLQALGVHPYRAQRMAMTFGDHDRHSLDELYSLYLESDEMEQRISLAKKSREELRIVYAADEAAIQEMREDEWG